MRKRCYRVAWVRGSERRSVRVWAFNKSDAATEGLREAERLGLDVSTASGWWSWGVEVER